MDVNKPGELADGFVWAQSTATYCFREGPLAERLPFGSVGDMLFNAIVRRNVPTSIGWKFTTIAGE